MIRLESVDKDLATKISAASSLQQRAVCLIACQIALQTVKIDIPIVKLAIEEIRVEGILSIQRMEELNSLLVHLDDSYFELQERSEIEIELLPEVLRIFNQARALSALSFAGSHNALTAAMESVYEASLTLEDATSLYDRLHVFLEGKQFQQ